LEDVPEKAQMNIEIDLHNIPANLRDPLINFMHEYYLLKRETEDLYKELGEQYDFEIFMILKYSRMLEMGEYAKEKYNMNFKAHFGYKVTTSYGATGLDPETNTDINKHYHVEKPDLKKVENLIKAYLPEINKTITPEMISLVVGFDDLTNRIDVENKIKLLWTKKEEK